MGVRLCERRFRPAAANDCRRPSRPAAAITGGLALEGDRVFVPVQGLNEEAMGGFAGYPCCTFRGSLSALDVNDLGADFDLSAPPMLVRLEGRELLVVPQKSGIAWALDPERLGTVVWGGLTGRPGNVLLAFGLP